MLASPLRETPSLLFAFCVVTASGTGYGYVHACQRVRHQLTRTNPLQLASMVDASLAFNAMTAEQPEIGLLNNGGLFAKPYCQSQ